MATLNYWTGTQWLPVSTGGAGGGVPGPAGADGISINVSGPQPTAPLNPRKGDQWLNNAALRDAEDAVEFVDTPAPEPETILVRRLPLTPEDSVTFVQMPTPEPEKILVKRLPPTPAPVIVYLN